MTLHALSVEQLLSALQRKGIPLPFEMGTFVVLEATEQALVLEATEDASGGLPLLGAREVWLSEQGELSVEPSGTVAAEPEACRALLRLLSELLVRSATGVPAMLLTLAEQGPSDGQWTLIRLRDDLEASLVPLNRAAMRRVLARLLRELRRDIERPSAAPAPNARMIDRELDAMLGIEPSEASAAQTAPVPEDAWVEEQPTSRHVRAREVAGRSPAERMPAPRLDEFERASSSPTSSTGLWIGIGFLLLACALVAGYLLLGRGMSRDALGVSPGAGAQQPAQEVTR